MVHDRFTVTCVCARKFDRQSSIINHWEQGNCPGQIDRNRLIQVVTEFPEYRKLIVDDRHGSLRNDTIRRRSASPNRHKENSRTLFKCDFCRKEYKTSQDLDGHLASAAHDPHVFKCADRECRLRFNSLSGLYQHAEAQRLDSRKRTESGNGCLERLWYFIDGQLGQSALRGRPRSIASSDQTASTQQESSMQISVMKVESLPVQPNRDMQMDSTRKDLTWNDLTNGPLKEGRTRIFNVQNPTSHCRPPTGPRFHSHPERSSDVTSVTCPSLRSDIISTAKQFAGLSDVVCTAIDNRRPIQPQTQKGSIQSRTRQVSREEELLELKARVVNSRRVSSISAPVPSPLVPEQSKAEIQTSPPAEHTLAVLPSAQVRYVVNGLGRLEPWKGTKEQEGLPVFSFIGISGPGCTSQASQDTPATTPPDLPSSHLLPEEFKFGSPSYE